jgi:hypothetical protein
LASVCLQGKLIERIDKLAKKQENEREREKNRPIDLALTVTAAAASDNCSMQQDRREENYLESDRIQSFG